MDLAHWAHEGAKSLGAMSWQNAFIGFVGSVALLLFTYLRLIVRRKQRDYERIYEAEFGDKKAVTDEREKPALPRDAGPRYDTAIERGHRETIERLTSDLERAQCDNSALRDSLADKRLVDADFARIQGALAEAHHQVEWLRAELARGMGVRPEDISIPPHPRTKGSQPALEPVAVPAAWPLPARPTVSFAAHVEELDDRITPPHGTKRPQ